MEKRPRRGLFVRVFCSHVLSGLSPYSVDNLSAVMREPPPLAAAPATERSERVGEEAEFPRKSDLSTYALSAPVLLSACDLTRPPGLSAGENAHGQAATAFASPFMVPYCDSKCVCMLSQSSSASSCSRSHRVACSSASSFSSNVRLWLLMNRAMLSAVCGCLFTFPFSVVDVIRLMLLGSAHETEKIVR